MTEDELYSKIESVRLRSKQKTIQLQSWKRPMIVFAVVAFLFALFHYIY